MTDETPLKRCLRGDQCVHPMGSFLPETADYFPRRSDCKEKFHAECHACRAQRSRNYRQKNSTGVRARRRQYYHAHREIENSRRNQWRLNNPKRSREIFQRWHRNNIERARELSRKYHRLHRNSQKAAHHRRRASKRGLPNTFTATDWQRALDYFNGCCAVCGRPLRDLFGSHTAAADHWIPLSDPRPDNPGTVPTNIVPLCHGEGGCNNSKHAHDPEQWLFENFPQKQAKAILRRINAYFASLQPGL